MAADSAATALPVATSFTVSFQRWNTSVHSNVILLSRVAALLSVYIADILMLLPLLSQCCLGHCCHSTVKYTADTILSLPPMLH